MNFLTENETSETIRKIKMENAFHYSAFEVKEEPIGIVEYETVSEHQIETEDAFCDSGYTVKQEEEEEEEDGFTHFEMNDLEIQEENVVESYCYDDDDRTEIAVCDTEIYIPHSHAIEVFKDEVGDEEIVAKSDGKPYRCNDCDYSCASLTTMKCHLRTHSGDKPFTCTKCDYSSSQFENLLYHIRSDTRGIHLNCAECHYRTNEKRYFESHIKSHSGNKIYMCNRCTYCTASSSNFGSHLGSHPVEMPYLCSECKYCFFRPRDLMFHSCKSKEDLPFDCPEEVNQHLEGHPKNLLTCSECEFCCTSRSELAEHMEVHPNEDFPVFKSRRKKIGDDDETWKPKNKIIVTTGPRTTRQGVCLPALGRNLKEVAVKKPSYHRKKSNPSGPQPSSSSSSFEANVKDSKHKKRRTKLITSKQRLAKIMKIR